jgi:hypothetical protein
MRQKRKGNIVELPLLLVMVVLSLAVFLAGQAYLKRADYGLLAFPLSFLVVVGFWATWASFCFVIATAIRAFRPASTVDTTSVFFLTIIGATILLNILGLGMLLWYLVIRPISGLFT